MHKKTDKDYLAEQVELNRKQQTKLTLQLREIAKLHTANDSAEKVRTEIYGLAAAVPDPPKWTKKPSLGKHTIGVPVTIWSDWHAGEQVFENQVGGVNKFNLAICRQRAERLVNSTLDLCFHHMVKPAYPGIIVCLGGDMITGAIHDELAETNDGTVQQALLPAQLPPVGEHEVQLFWAQSPLQQSAKPEHWPPPATQPPWTHRSLPLQP